jgi:hypothetical protein
VSERDEFYRMILARLERERDNIHAAIQAVREIMELEEDNATDQHLAKHDE